MVHDPPQPGGVVADPPAPGNWVSGPPMVECLAGNFLAMMGVSDEHLVGGGCLQAVLWCPHGHLVAGMMTLLPWGIQAWL